MLQLRKGVKDSDQIAQEAKFPAQEKEEVGAGEGMDGWRLNRCLNDSYLPRLCHFSMTRDCGLVRASRLPTIPCLGHNTHPPTPLFPPPTGQIRVIRNSDCLDGYDPARLITYLCNPVSVGGPGGCCARRAQAHPPHRLPASLSLHSSLPPSSTSRTRPGATWQMARSAAAIAACT